MKKIILISLSLFAMICPGIAQTATDKPRFLKRATLLTPIDFTKYYSEEGFVGGNSSTLKLKTNENSTTDTILIKSLLIDKNNAFDIIQQIGRFSIIKFWDLSQSHATNLSSRLKAAIAPQALPEYDQLKVTESFAELNVKGLVAVRGTELIDLSRTHYIVPTKTLLDNSNELENKGGLWNIGLLVLPIKLRPFATEKGQFDFSSGFSVGPTFAWTVHHNWQSNFTHNFLAYVGLSSYTADSIKIKENRDDYKISTFSPGIGWMWEKNNVQLSLLTGIDFPSGKIQQRWVYRNKPWFGLGLGISLFKINDDETTKNGKN